MHAVDFPIGIAPALNWSVLLLITTIWLLGLWARRSVTHSCGGMDTKTAQAQHALPNGGVEAPSSSVQLPAGSDWENNYSPDTAADQMG